MRGAFAALLGLAAVLRIGLLVHAELDPDESQHLHAAWLVGEGRVPYVDFWEHHTPLLYYLLAPVTRLFAESTGVYFAGRALMVLAAAVALVLIYRVARRISATAAMGAVVLLAVLPRFTEFTTEVRPDGPALVAWLACLLCLERWREESAPGWLWAAGLALGLAGALTAKAVWGGLAASLIVAIGSATGWPGAARCVSASVTRLAVGVAVPLLAMLAWLRLTGGPSAVPAFARHVVLQSLRFADLTKEGPASTDVAGLYVLALAGIALTLRREGGAALRHPVHGPLLVSMVVISAGLLFPGTPAVYGQTWLPVLAAAAVYGGVAVAALVDRLGARAGFATAALGVAAGFLALVLPVTVAARAALTDRNQEQLRVMRLMLRHACPGEPVLDGTALYVFRPAAHRYSALIRGVRLWIANGAIAEETIVEDLRRTRPRIAYPDPRLRALVGPVADFLASHYVRSPEGLLVAGATVPVPGGPGGGRVYVEFVARGWYRLGASRGIEASIDGAPVRPGLVELEAGRHEVTWAGPPGAISLVAATCGEMP